MTNMEDTDWDRLVDEKRRDRDSRIPKEWRLPSHIVERVSSETPTNAFDVLKANSLLTPRETHLTERYTAQQLLRGIASGTLTSLEVCSAFCKRAAIAQQLVGQINQLDAQPRWPDLDRPIARLRYSLKGLLPGLDSWTPTLRKRKGQLVHSMACPSA
jgi:hypothetical protein